MKTNILEREREIKRGVHDLILDLLSHDLILFKHSGPNFILSTSFCLKHNKLSEYVQRPTERHVITLYIGKAF